VSCSDQDTAILHRAGPSENSITIDRTIAISPVVGQVCFLMLDRHQIWCDFSLTAIIQPV
jgi:hypothetical protein